MIFWSIKKAVERTFFYIALSIERCINCNVSDNAGFAAYSSKLFVDCRKVDLSTNYSKRFWFSFAISLARLLIYNFTKSDRKNLATFLQIELLFPFYFLSAEARNRWSTDQNTRKS